MQLLNGPPRTAGPSTLLTQGHQSMQMLARAIFIALTGAHWTSVSNQNYLPVTAQLINDKWLMHLFALCVLKTEERHFPEACTSSSSNSTWTHSNGNIITAAVSQPYQHMPCVAHIIQSASTVALGESRFVVKKKKTWTFQTVLQTQQSWKFSKPLIIGTMIHSSRMYQHAGIQLQNNKDPLKNKL